MGVFVTITNILFSTRENASNYKMENFSWPGSFFNLHYLYALATAARASREDKIEKIDKELLVL